MPDIDNLFPEKRSIDKKVHNSNEKDRNYKTQLQSNNSHINLIKSPSSLDGKELITAGMYSFLNL